MSSLLNTTPIKIPASFYCRNLQDDSKMYMKMQRTKLTFIKRNKIIWQCSVCPSPLRSKCKSLRGETLYSHRGKETGAGGDGEGGQTWPTSDASEGERNRLGEQPRRPQGLRRLCKEPGPQARAAVGQAQASPERVCPAALLHTALVDFRAQGWALDHRHFSMAAARTLSDIKAYCEATNSDSLSW